MNHKSLDQDAYYQYKQNLFKHNSFRKASIESFKEKFGIKTSVSN